MRFLLFLTMASLSLQAGTLILPGLDPARGGSLDFMEDGATVNGYAGAINATYDGTTITPLFCIDLFTNINVPGTYTSTPYFPRAWRNEDRAAWLYTNELSTVTSVVLGEAFQLAIWDIIHDNGDGVSAGRVQAAGTTSAGVVTAWNNYLALSRNMSSNSGTIYVNFSGTTPEQTLIGGGQPFDVLAPTPEPGTGLIAGVGLALLAASQIRRRTPVA